MKLFYSIRILYKCFKVKHFSTNSFCKECGRDVHDFIVDDEVWNKVDALIRYGHVLCYDCFCEKCRLLDLPVVWRLKNE